jgi:hypothetical protein
VLRAMTHEAKLALEKIVATCEKSGNLTMTQIRIFDMALEGLGYVASQRGRILEKWKAPHIEKITKRRERFMARMEQVA